MILDYLFFGSMNVFCYWRGVFGVHFLVMRWCCCIILLDNLLRVTDGPTGHSWDIGRYYQLQTTPPPVPADWWVNVDCIADYPVIVG